MIAYSHTKNRLKYSFQSVFNAVPALNFRDDKGSIAKICLVPITVSQLKCALHILIGDWYQKTRMARCWTNEETNAFSSLAAADRAFAALDLRGQRGRRADHSYARPRSHSIITAKTRRYRKRHRRVVAMIGTRHIFAMLTLSSRKCNAGTALKTD